MKVKFLIFIFLTKSLLAFNIPFIKFFSKESEEVVVKGSSKVTFRNLDEVLQNAVLNRRIYETDRYKLHIIYSNIPNGSKLLNICLKDKKCNPYEFAKIVQKSELHKEIILKNPSLTLTQVNHKVGLINEKVMNNYFISTGWKKIEGEVGRNGIDGLFVKKKNGKIVDVLLVESKYNKSQLMATKNGKQMSKQWALKKIDELIKKYPDNPEYYQIKRFIQNDNYRALLWNMKVEKNKLVLSLKRIKEENGNLIKQDLKGGEKMKINYQGNQTIDLKNPQNNFHLKIVQWYNNAFDEVIK
ncbi:hypothetical protein [Caminibacter sp.]